jgi:hypothetical protein
MGFIVKKKIETVNGKLHDEFYVRIETFQYHKVFGSLNITVGRYDTVENAKKCIPNHIELTTGTAEGMIPVSFKVDGIDDEAKEYAIYHPYELTTLEEVTLDFEESRLEYEEVEYVDFDESGSEVIKTRLHPYEATYTGSVDVMYHKKTFESHTGSIYEIGYEKLKEEYGTLFGSENIIDSI